MMSLIITFFIITMIVIFVSVLTLEIYKMSKYKRNQEKSFEDAVEREVRNRMENPGDAVFWRNKFNKAEIRAEQAEYVVAVIDDNECNSACDSVAHDDDCPVVHPIAILVHRVRELEQLLDVCRSAIKSLPIDALGEGDNGEFSWPIRDELINGINKALTQDTKK